jgi:hypothetical protein
MWRCSSPTKLLVMVSRRIEIKAGSELPRWKTTFSRMQPGGKYFSRKLPILTFDAVLSPSLARTDDSLKGQKWCSSTTPAAATHRSTTTEIAAMRLMGLRDCVGVLTKDIFLGLQPAVIWHALLWLRL